MKKARTAIKIETKPYLSNNNNNNIIIINYDRSIKANWSDIIVKDCTKKTCLLIDMTVPSDRNRSLKEYEKMSKYKDLEIEIKKMWHLKVIVMPVVVGALGMIKKKTEDHVKRLPGNPCL